MRGSGSCAGNGCCWLSAEDEAPLPLSLAVPLRSSHAEESVLLQPDGETLGTGAASVFPSAFGVWNVMNGGSRPERVLSEDTFHQERRGGGKNMELDRPLFRL